MINQIHGESKQTFAELTNALKFVAERQTAAEVHQGNLANGLSQASQAMEHMAANQEARLSEMAKQQDERLTNMGKLLETKVNEQRRMEMEFQRLRASQM